MYEIKNISGYLFFLGLYPGESKNVETIDAAIKELYGKQLVSIRKTVKSKTKTAVEATKVVTDNLKDCEVINTDGRN